MRGSEVRVLFPAPFPGRRASRPVARRPPPGASGGELHGMAFKLDRKWPAQEATGAMRSARNIRNSAWARTRNTSQRSEEHTSELQSQSNLVCRLLLEKKKKLCIL